MILTIEYCTSWGYLARAVGLSRKILGEFKNNLSELRLIPSSGGVYEIRLDDKLIFSKKVENRYPESDEIIALIKKEIEG